MITFPTDQKTLRSRISSYKSALRKEKKTYGSISDGAGKRMTLFCLYFILDDHKASREYFTWYQAEFPDDMGEPIQHLCWSLILQRMGKFEEAAGRLAIAMLSNLYMIPIVLGRNVERLLNQHSSNFEDLGYIEECPDEMFDCITLADRDWLTLRYDSVQFARLRKVFLKLETDLQDLEVGPKRIKLVNQIFALRRDPLACA